MEQNNMNMKEYGQSKEAFIYLWYDAPNKKFYLGRHKGTPDDSYTHSSRHWEHFTKDNIPEGVRRRILVYGTDEEIWELEHKLLKNRKKRCWNKYYNESLGDPFRVNLSGEDIWNWKGGISLGENRPEYMSNDYVDRKKRCEELIKQGLSYYEIREADKSASIAYPYSLLPQEVKDKRNEDARKRTRTRECYCRKYSCDYCGPILIAKHGTKEERHEKSKKKGNERYRRDRNDPVKLEHKRKVAKAWEEKNKEKRRKQQRERNAEKKKKGSEKRIKVL